MTLAEKVAAHLPYLRRFARSLTGSQKSGDAYVASTLEAILADPSIFQPELPARIALYRTFLSIFNSVALNTQATDAGSHALDAAKRNFDMLTPPARQAFLLIAVEEFSPQDAALVLNVSPAEVQGLIDEAGREIARQIATDVVIIEDEPLIAMDLERMLRDLGHRVTSVARTHKDALKAATVQKPGLVLADIRLADGSSGLDAVNDILGTLTVPVVFITAYPQKLMTGERPEPTFLITKPFREDAVKAIISQVLFFDQQARRRTNGRSALTG